jgi:nucleoid DNA-binding protein
MNKESLIKKILAKNSVPVSKGEAMVNRIFDLIKNSIRENKSFNIENFGSFEVYNREMQTYTDYKKKSEILLPPKDKLDFIPSEKLLAKLRKADE